MSMSMRVDRQQRTGVTIKPRTPTTWIPDCRVRRCFACTVTFNLLKRKHHCRACGRVFCASCTSYRVELPTYDSNSRKKQRMCGNCARNTREAAGVEWLVRSLSIMPVTFPELFLLRVLDKTWNLAVNTLLSFYRGLAYALPGQQYSVIECNFLRTHFREFDGHVPWQIHAIVALVGDKSWKRRISFPKFRKKISCRWLLCSRTCRPTVSISDIIHLGVTGCLSAVVIQNWTISTWAQMQPEIHIKMMSWWVWIALKYRILFEKGLIPLCSRLLALTYALWFECDLQKTPQNVKFLREVQQSMERTSDLKTALHKSYNFAKLLATLGRSPSEHLVQAFFTKYRSVRLPWNPNIMITNITNMSKLKSASRPIVCNCTTTKAPIQLLIKNEDVRTDRLAMSTSYWIANLCEGIVMPVYNVFPLNALQGCVEMIPNATTLYDVRKNSTLLNFIMNGNANTTVATMRERMVSSCAGACLLAFTMGLGDRHLENILVTHNGYVVHVDFGYVFGDDPKHAATPMRITEDMVDAMGGRDSVTFQSFVHRTQKGYESMRLHSSFWYHQLSAEFYIFQDQSRPTKRIRDHILDRFVPGEWDSEASLHIQTVVHRAVEHSWLQLFSDLTHSASNRFDDILKLSR